MLSHLLVRLLLGIIGCGLLGLASVASADNLTITHFVQVSSRRVSLYEFDYTLRADIINSGPAVTQVGATVTSKPTSVTVIDGALTFGDVPAGATVTSQDTFTIRVDRRVGFQPTDLVWNISSPPAQNLIARFRAVPATGTAPLTVTLYPEPVTDTAIQYFYWDLDGNGTFERSDTVGRSQTYTYSQPGTYHPALRVIDTRGAQDTQSLTLGVGNAPPVVSASANPTNGQVPLTVTFAATATDNEGIARYEWDFDGNGSYDYSSPSSAATTYTYTAVGTYSPVLRVTDQLGAPTMIQLPSTEVRAAPVGAIAVQASASPVDGEVPLAVTFSGTASTPGGQVINQWQWDFDGNGSYDFSAPNSAVTTHTYTAPGTVYARLRITATDGSSAEDVVTLNVTAQNQLSLSTDTIDTTASGSVNVNTVLGGDSRVSVVIENRLGQVVRTLVPWTQRSAGSYSDVWRGEADDGSTVVEGPYYAILLYELNGQVNRLDLALTTGGQEYNPPRSTVPSSFSPFAGQPLLIDFILDKASVVTAFIGRFYSDTRLVTFLQRTPLGRGTHQIVWNGETNDGQLIHPPPGDSFLPGIFGYYFPDNGLYVRSGVHITSLTVTPSIFDPAGYADNQGTPNRSQLTVMLSKPANVELVISNADSGATVARRFFTGLAKGSNTLYWDGRDDNGVLVAPGNYRLGVAAMDSSGYRSLLLYALQRVYY